MKLVCVREQADGVTRRRPIALGEGNGLRTDDAAVMREAVRLGIAGFGDTGCAGAFPAW